MTTVAERAGGTEPRPADSRTGRLLARVASRPADRLLGTALAVAACDPPAVPDAPLLAKVAVFVAAVAAWSAAPMVDTRPVLTSLRWQGIAARRRTTLLPAAAIAVAAVTDPAPWLVACIAALLLAYLLVTDAWAAGVTAPPGSTVRRQAAPALTGAATAAVVLLAAQAPVAGTSWARLPAALAVGATVVCLVLALRARRQPPG